MRYLLILSICLSLLPAKVISVRQLFNVQTVKVKKAYQYRDISAYGFIRADQNNIYDIAPRFGGYVEKLYVDKIYQKVRKGELLATVYSPVVLKAKDNYLSSLTYTKSIANKYMKQNAKNRLRLLNIPTKEISAIAKKLRVSLYTNIYAPANGYVFIRKLNKGSAFNKKETIFRIINLNDIWVEAKIDQKQLKYLNKMTSFTFKTPGIHKTFGATMAELYPDVSSKSSRLTLRLKANNKNHKLFPGMYVSINMHSAAKEYLTLPSTAVIFKNGKHYVFTVGEYAGEYDPQVVQVEVLDPHTYIIKSGLKDGQKVVNNALFMMDSDAQINGLY